eukprot:scaffold11464_cov16-Tisochrysis_lutea.AAC.1
MAGDQKAFKVWTLTALRERTKQKSLGQEAADGEGLPRGMTVKEVAQWQQPLLPITSTVVSLQESLKNFIPSEQYSML